MRCLASPRKEDEADFYPLQLNAPRTLLSSIFKALSYKRRKERSRLSLPSPKSRVRSFPPFPSSFLTPLAVLPKKGSIFTFLLPLPLPPSADASETKRELSFDIYGDAFCYRSAERVGKKFKSGSGGGGVELL